jgi:hypothetical protein
MSTTFEFLKADFAATLFPLKTNLLIAEKHEKEISDYIYKKILDEANAADNFLPQQRVHATKPRGHLRRTVKLDPVAEYFLYDITYRNRNIFRPQVSAARRSFGYRFEGGVHISVHSAYGQYKQSLIENDVKFKHKLQFDIASYFNCLYHHDVYHWFASKGGVSDVDSSALGKCFREINAGRSVDFLPQGIYPCKMIGNEFLKVVDLSAQLKASVVVRFMDDFTLFGNEPDILHQDFIRIQQLLGQFGLNVNPSKTYYDKSLGDVENKLSALHESLLEIVREIEEVPSGVDSIEVEAEESMRLTGKQIEALLALLRDDSLEESDADLLELPSFAQRQHS